ncbi:MAG: protein tyrosine phosphatase family protein [Burkholderiales bacterium]|nr:protein tyrosine phosphatase family protein [Burkholderiales bacterium]
MNTRDKQRAKEPRRSRQRVRAWVFPIVVLVALSGYLRVALPFAIDPGRIAVNYVENTGRVGSSGMPTEHQFSEIAHSGYEVVVNLVPAGSVGAHPDEQGLVERSGMRYYGIPVSYTAPRAEDFEQFVRVVRQSDGKRVLAHCQLGWRASTFVFLYRVIELGEDPDAAFEDVLRVWSPASHWRAFIRDTLRERNKPLPARLAA